MPTTDSNLTGTFIGNTYQKILQVDTNYGATGISSYNQTDNMTTSKYTVLNGLGQIQKGLTIDSAGDSNAGLFIKDNSNRLMGIQYQDAVDGEGLNFWTPGSINANLFLKNTGSVWVGYTSGSNIPVTPDVSGYSLYVKNGVQVGQDTTGNNGRVNLIGDSPLENNTGFFINGEHPFKIYRYQVNDQYIDDTQRFLKDEFGQMFSTSEWTALVIGQQIIDFDGVVNSQIGLGITLRPDPSGFWEAYLYASTGDGTSDTKLWIWDVMMIKKGFYQDRRLTTLTPINLT